MRVLIYSWRFRAPVLPLTEAGRVLVCVAASVFAALLLVAWTTVPADDSDNAAPAEAPRFTVASASD